MFKYYVILINPNIADVNTALQISFYFQSSKTLLENGGVLFTILRNIVADNLLRNTVYFHK